MIDEKVEVTEERPFWWVDLGAWHGNDSWDEDSDKRSVAVGNRILSEIPEARYSGGDSPSLVFKTLDRDEAETVLKKATDIVAEMEPDWIDLIDGMNIVAQPECPDCHALVPFSDRRCYRCGAKIV